MRNATKLSVKWIFFSLKTLKHYTLLAKIFCVKPFANNVVSRIKKIYHWYWESTRLITLTTRLFYSTTVLLYCNLLWRYGICIYFDFVLLYLCVNVNEHYISSWYSELVKFWCIFCICFSHCFRLLYNAISINEWNDYELRMNGYIFPLDNSKLK